MSVEEKMKRDGKIMKKIEEERDVESEDIEENKRKHDGCSDREERE